MSIVRGDGTTGKITFPSQMSCAERKHIAVFVCDKCGKLKRFVEEI
jgi:Fe2+ or Zn2+ uptake regulation protein